MKPFYRSQPGWLALAGGRLYALTVTSYGHDEAVHRQIASRAFRSSGGLAAFLADAAAGPPDAALATSPTDVQLMATPVGGFVTLQMTFTPVIAVAGATQVLYDYVGDVLGHALTN